MRAECAGEAWRPQVRDGEGRGSARKEVAAQTQGARVSLSGLGSQFCRKLVTYVVLPPGASVSSPIKYG